MNFDDAVRAHSAWKAKLAAYIQKPDKSLNADVVAGDQNCELGKWIYGEGAKHSSNPEFQQLRIEHAQFHKCAGQIIRRADRGEKVAEEIALGAKSVCGAASSNVVSLIMAMKRRAA
jgi:methyl-accepting chemotaxis protein